jgi:hypothetical protein
MDVIKMPQGYVVQIPDDVAKRLSLKPGDKISEYPNALFTEAEWEARQRAFDEGMARLRSKGPLFPAGYKFKRSDAYDED